MLFVPLPLWKQHKTKKDFLGMNTNVIAISDSHCPICLDSLDTTADHAATTLRCGHVFGRTCIVEWTKAKRSCPLCRRHIGYHQLKEIQRSRMQLLNRPLRERYIELAVLSGLMTMVCYPAHSFFATVKVAGTIMAPIFCAATYNALIQWERGRGNLRGLLIERYAPFVDSIIGVASGLAISSTLQP